MRVMGWTIARYIDSKVTDFLTATISRPIVSIQEVMSAVRAKFTTPTHRYLLIGERTHEELSRPRRTIGSFEVASRWIQRHFSDESIFLLCALKDYPADTGVECRSMHRDPFLMPPSKEYWVGAMQGVQDLRLTIFITDSGTSLAEGGMCTIWAYGTCTEVMLPLPAARIDLDWYLLPYVLANARAERRLYFAHRPKLPAVNGFD